MMKSRLIAIGIVSVIGGVAGVRAAQAPATPSFEVASIKPNKAGPPQSLGPDPPGRVVLPYVTVSTLVGFAYRVRDAQVVGAPGWAQSEPFDIEATTGGPARPAQISLMMQTLLAERFNLKVHHETRDLPVLELTTARSDKKLGPRLAPATAEDTACSGGRAPTPIFPGGPEVEPCGGGFTATGIYQRGTTMDRFARLWLETSLRVGPTVVNRTGLDGPFNVWLDWGPDGNARDTGTIITLLLDQLGLKLASSKAPTDVVVIDHAEHPTPD
jgi:uncharacterized protein (TIGR03435 family)